MPVTALLETLTSTSAVISLTFIAINKDAISFHIYLDVIFMYYGKI